MARWEPEQTVTQSVLERLIDREPGRVAADAADSRAQSVRQLKASLRRDLEWLLNTRRTPEAVGQRIPRAASSRCTISACPTSPRSAGTPSATGTRLARMVEQTIAHFRAAADARQSDAARSRAAARSTCSASRSKACSMMDPAPEHDLVRHRPATCPAASTRSRGTPSAG